eukprot:TRINITY_DN5974_c0_g1_i2.p2 TRINITY_DN5974_c0_g1~~TRINITY_DN5974_c0_g1_i2.p2  ORF type:complete len:239 (-),score=24.56 TRINITY_DN5974_c0_g1_i2:395-1111(-)
MSHLVAVQATNALLAKSDGRDKFIATIQYVLMLISGGKAGMAKDLQGKVASARKVFRILKPLEQITPLLKDPYLRGNKPLYQELLPKVKSICMTVYFACDHVVWLGSANVIKDKTLLERCQKSSLWGWFLGSICTMITESGGLMDGSLDIKRTDEEDDEWEVKRAEMAKTVRRKVIVLVHAIIQGLLAAGLLQLRPFHPRTTATFGVLASAINCYMLMPPLPKAASPPPPPKPVSKED